MNFRNVNRIPRDRSLETETSRTLQGLVATASLEVLARDIVQRPAILEQVEPDTEVYVPFPPTGSWEETLAASRSLAERGCRPIPHLPARRLKNRDELIQWAKSLESAGVRSVMLIAGDVLEEQVYFKDSLELLQTKILVTHGVERVGVAVYPDGHPYIAKKDLNDAFLRKLDVASRDGFMLKAVTQFGFDASPLLAWLTKASDLGLQVPVSVGVAGPTQMKTLIRYAAKCGVRHSVRGLLTKPSALRMLGQWDPISVLSPVAERLSSGLDVRVENAHVFTFGGVRKVIEWREQLLKRCEPIVASEVHE
ncbi:MAG: methylenetetrahydrofolate reductase [Gammaproteobacteria bacterium]|nr:methylenetetrahydrofolate reductase [Gammaproteobacteria bacterium]